MKDFKNKYGPWALITGASSGIGEAFASLLAVEGLNLVLAARRKDRLVALAQKLETQFNIEIRTVEVDLLNQNFLDSIKQVTDDLQIGLLINNAGQLILNSYMETSMKEESKMIDLNIKTPAILTHHFTEKMIRRGKGGIINVASVLAYMGVPFSAAYAATKAYELVKSEGLWYELKKHGVDVLSLNPGLTKSEMTNNYDFSHMPMKLMNPPAVANTAIKALGKKSQVTPGRMNKMLVFMSKHFMSRDMNTKMFGMLMGKTYDKLQQAN